MGVNMGRHQDTNIRLAGFTLVELMITLAISTLIVAAIYAAYRTQRDVYEAQVQVTEIQQNLRAATGQMVREIRLAGFDPECEGEYKILLSDADGATDGDSLRFDADLCKDGGLPSDCAGGANISAPEKFSYRLDGSGGLLRLAPSMPAAFEPGEPIADHIEDLEFYYTMNDGAQTLTPNAAQTENIRTIQISILGRARRPDPNFTTNLTYTTGSGATWGPYPDNFRRYLLITTVHIRNEGLCK